MAERRINVDYLPRVEGEGALRVKIQNDRVTDVELNIYEPPRFFEAFLRGREGPEAVDITARICGICPVAYQMSAAHALEVAYGVTPPPGVRALRRLFYCGEWIESHVLHVFMLHAPDFLGFDSSLSMAADPSLRPWVERALRMKKIGNEIVSLIGGREIHPVSACVGGFYKAPRRAAVQALEADLAWGLETSMAAVKLVAGLEYPDFAPDYEFVSLRHPDEYPMNEGRIVSSAGLDIPMADYETHFVEDHVARSNAIHSVRAGNGNSYMVGPLSRLNLNADRLFPTAQEALRLSGLALPVRNPFLSLIARMIETVHAFEEALSLVRTYEPPDPPRAAVTLGSGQGAWATEAPRGILYHRYTLGEGGRIVACKIMPPTAQNLRRMEDDLWQFVPGVLALPPDRATLRCEQLVRCYDPCISCATHFLRLEIDRR